MQNKNEHYLLILQYFLKEITFNGIALDPTTPGSAPM